MYSQLLPSLTKLDLDNVIKDKTNQNEIDTLMLVISIRLQYTMCFADALCI